MANILIIGCGDIGQHTAVELIKNKHQVTGLRRNPPEQSKRIDSSIRWMSADLTRPETLHVISDEFDYILYMPAPKRNSEASLEQTYRNVFWVGLQHIIAKVEKFQQLKRFIFISSVSVFGQNKGQWLNENSLPLPQRFNGKILLEAENLVSSANFPSTSIRFAGIYGPGRHHLINAVNQGSTIQTTHPKYTNRIHSVDCAGLLNFLIQKDLLGYSLDSLYIGVDELPCSEQEIKHFIYRLLLDGGLSPKPLTIDNSSENQNKRCSNKAIKSLGYKFIYDSYLIGYSDIISDYISQNQHRQSHLERQPSP